MSEPETLIRTVLASHRLVRVGHRGAAALAPENTLDALGAALEAGVDMVEFDVVRGPGGALMLAHDVASVTGESPTLDAALDFLGRDASRGVAVDLDLKVEGVERELVEALRRFEFLERTIVCALHASWLRDVRRIDAAVVVGLSYPRDRAGIADRSTFEPLVRTGTAVLRGLLPWRVLGMAERAGASALMLHHSVVSAQVVQTCARRKLPVFAWTVDDSETLHAVRSAGVHGVISNDPRIFTEPPEGAHP